MAMGFAGSLKGSYPREKGAPSTITRWLPEQKKSPLRREGGRLRRGGRESPASIERFDLEGGLEGYVVGRGEAEQHLGILRHHQLGLATPGRATVVHIAERGR